MRLSRYEKETIILLNAAEDTASIYTADPVWKRKLDKLVEKNPQCYQCVKADEVSKTYSCLLYTSMQIYETGPEIVGKIVGGQLPENGSDS